MAVKVVKFPVGSDLFLMEFLRQQGVLNERYLAFSMPLSGNGYASDLERRLADVGEVGCDVLGTGDLHHCNMNSFFKGESAIVVYDRRRLEEIEPHEFRRPNPQNPSKYVAIVIVPKVKEVVLS